MFKRRQPLSALQNLRELFWPSMGWLRMMKYMWRRILRLSDSPYRIAGGMAAGASISFTPILGTHILQAFAISFFIRTNYFAAMVGTVIGNPWTFPIMWYLSYKLGLFIFGMFGHDMTLDFNNMNEFSELVGLIMDQPLGLILPWLVGGYVLALLTWPIYFAVFYALVKQLKSYQKTLRLKQLHKAAIEVTGQKD